MTTRVLLLLASLATTAVALWLLWVSAVVLPARDPSHIAMWRTIAAAFIAFSVLSAVSAAGGSGHGLLRGALGLASLAAICAGVYGIASMARSVAQGGGFEGYIVLMGVILIGHGTIGIAHAFLAGRTGAPLSSP